MRINKRELEHNTRVRCCHKKGGMFGLKKLTRDTQEIKSGGSLLAAAAAAYISSKTGITAGIINALPSSDDTARSQFAGENHALLKLKGLKFGIGNYIGPGTHIQERIARNDPPRTLTDKTAQAHDLRYSKAKTVADVRMADEAMVSALKRIEKDRTDSRFNIAQGMKLIQLKMSLENKGLMSKGSFADLKNAAGHVMTPAMNEKLAELTQQGFGKVKEEPTPIDLLRKKMAKFSLKGSP